MAILGFGVEGRSLLKYLLADGYSDLTVCDRNPELADEILKVAQEGVDKVLKETGSKGMPHKASVKYKLGEEYLEDLNKFDLVFRSPGIHYNGQALNAARNAGVRISSSTALFFERANGKIVGVTGTKGKGTTSTLIYRMLKEAGEDVYLGGNIGVSPLTFLNDLTDDSISVLELSSFQLQDLEMSPDIAVVLKTTIEHLDYHDHMEEYWEAKALIVRQQTSSDQVIVNVDYPYASYFLQLTNAEPWMVSCRKEVERGAFMKKDAVVLKKDGELLAVCKRDELGLIGPHNLENVTAAVTAAALCEVDVLTMKKVLVEFTGLPHRLELVGEIDGVKYYNDSFSSIPETTIAAIDSFTQPIVLMVGGSEKHSDFKELAKKIVKTKRIKTVVFMGEQAGKRLLDEVEKINEEMTVKAKKMETEGKAVPGRDVELKIVEAQTFGEAFLGARYEAQDGDVVLLSPACASFDWFENYKVRGETFREMVKVQASS